MKILQNKTKKETPEEKSTLKVTTTTKNSKHFLKMIVPVSEKLDNIKKGVGAITQLLKNKTQFKEI